MTIRLFAAFAAALVLTSPALPQQVGRETSVALAAEQNAWPRDQPRLASIRSWGDKWIVWGKGGVFEIDPVRNVAQPMHVNGSKIAAVCVRDATTLVVISHSGEFAKLWMLSPDKSPEEIQLPRPVRASAVGFLAASAEQVVLVEGGEVLRYGNGTWDSAKLAVSASVSTGVEMGGSLSIPTCSLMNGNEVYMGYDQGEFGGGLAVLDLPTGVIAGPPSLETWADFLPVVALDRAPDGAVWVVSGLVHLRGLWVEIQRFDGQQWSRVLDLDSSRKPVRRKRSALPVPRGETALGWKLGATDIRGITFEPTGAALIVTGHYGVVRLDKGVWTQMTKDWPKGYCYVADIARSPAGDLAIATCDAGVILVERDTYKVRRIDLNK